MVQEVKTMAELKEILQKEDAVVVDFSATWCGPCNEIAPFYEELSKEYTNITFLKVEADTIDGTDNFKVTGLPTFVFFKNNEEVSRLVGARKKDLRNRVKDLASEQRRHSPLPSLPF